MHKFDPMMVRRTEKRDRQREAKAEVAAQLEKSIEKELLERLQKGVYPTDIVNINMKEYEKVQFLKGNCLEHAALPLASITVTANVEPRLPNNDWLELCFRFTGHFDMSDYSSYLKGLYPATSLTRFKMNETSWLNPMPMTSIYEHVLTVWLGNKKIKASCQHYNMPVTLVWLSGTGCRSCG